MSFLNKMGNFDAVSLVIDGITEEHWVYLKRVPYTKKNVTLNNEEMTAWSRHASITHFNGKSYVYQVCVSTSTYQFLTVGKYRTLLIAAGQKIRMVDLATGMI